MYILFFYLLALICSLLRYRSFTDTPLAYFPLLIAYTLFNELLGFLVSEFPEFSFVDQEQYANHNTIIYTIYSVIFHLYVFWVYNKVLAQDKHKMMAKAFFLMVIPIYLISNWFQDILHENFYVAKTLSSLFTIIIVLLHLRQLETTAKSPKKINLMFWFGLGMLLINLYMPIFMLVGNLWTEWYYTLHLRTVLFVIVATMYCMFSYGFLIHKRWAFN